MNRKYKATGCAKFFLFLLLFVPVAVIGALLIRGENPMEVIPKWLDGEATEIQLKPKKKSDNSLEKQIDNLENIIKAKDREIESLEQKIEELEKG